MLEARLAACRTQVFESETVAERAQILPILTRISGICKEKAVNYGPRWFLFSGTVAAESS
jgi:hypothetical protein